MMTNALKLKARMVECGYTQKSLALVLHISPMALGLKINGKNDFRQSEIKQLISILKLSEDDVVTIFFAAKMS